MKASLHRCLLATGAISLLAIGSSHTMAQDRMADFVPLTEDMLLNPDPEDWIMVGGNYQAWSHSQLDQINADNVGQLQLVWARQQPTFDGLNRNGTSPLIYDGIMYLAGPADVIQAIDAATGSLIWEYRRELPEIGPDEGMIHHIYTGSARGLAVYGDRVYTVTKDNAVVALDARTGQVVWEHFRDTNGWVSNAQGPTIANGILIAGGSCQNAPIGCYVTGHDLETGEELWRNEVIPRPGDPGDETWRGVPYESRWCTGVWGQIVYDPVLNLLNYGSTGNCPAADLQRGVAGMNATNAGTNERWAVRPETGEVVWRRQLLPQDNWDQECTFEMMTVETAMRPNPEAEGMLAANPNVDRDSVRALVGMPCKNPVFWALDAATGEFFYARETFDGAQNIYESIDPVTGLTTINQDVVLDAPGKEVFFCTTYGGGRDATAASYDPTRNLMFQATGNLCTYSSAREDVEPTPAAMYNTNTRVAPNPNVAEVNGVYPVGRITAVDVTTGDTVWQYLNTAHNYSAVLSTDGGLIFNGDGDRYFFALDSDTGERVWQVRLGSMCCGYPVTYAVDGRQYVAVVAGYGRATGANFNANAPIDGVGGHNMVYVFALPE